MAVTKAKRSVHKKQSPLAKAARRHDRRATNRHPDRRKPAERRTSNRISAAHRFRKLVHYPQAKGKTIEDVEFSTAPGYHNISVNFQDKTCLNFSIETGFTLETDYSDWKTGNQRLLRVWRPIHSHI